MKKNYNGFSYSKNIENFNAFFAWSFHHTDHTQTSYFWWVKGKVWTAFWCKSIWYRQPLSWKIHWIFLKRVLHTYIFCEKMQYKKLETMYIHEIGYIYAMSFRPFFYIDCKKNRILLGIGIFRSRICCAFMNSTFKSRSQWD